MIMLPWNFQKPIAFGKELYQVAIRHRLNKNDLEPVCQRLCTTSGIYRATIYHAKTNDAYYWRIVAGKTKFGDVIAIDSMDIFNKAISLNETQKIVDEILLNQFEFKLLTDRHKEML